MKHLFIDKSHTPGNVNKNILHLQIHSTMAKRFSIVKRLFAITYSDFTAIASKFIQTTTILWHHQSSMRITLYSAIPSSTTTQDMLTDMLDASNSQIVLKQCATLNDVTEDEFKHAAYIDIRIAQTVSDRMGLATISFKGLCPRHAVCSVQPCDSGEAVAYQMIQKSSFGMLFTHGDGKEENLYMISLSLESRIQQS